MKKIMNFFVFVAAAAMALTSCQKSEIENVKPQEYEYTFLIGNADTKATIGDNCVEWESGDQIGVYTKKVAAGTISNNAYGDITPGTPATMKMYSNQALAIGDYIYAYYPYYSGNTNGELTVTMTIPASQTGKNDMPMVANPHCVDSAIATGQQDAPAGKLQFANLGSVIEFNVYSTEYATESVSSVSFAANKALAGTFSINLENVDYSNPSTLAISGYSENTVVSSLSTPVAVGADKATATKVKMVVAPGSYSGTVVVTTDKATYTYNIGTEKEFARSSVKQLGVNLDNGEREEIEGTTATLTFDENKENRTFFSSEQQVWEQNGIVFTNDKANSTSDVADYGNPARFYKNSTISIEAPGSITKIIFTCKEGGADLKTAVGESASISNQIVTVELDGSSNSVTYSLSAGKVFVYSIDVTYSGGSYVPPTLLSIAVSGNYKTEFTQNSEFSFGGVVTATYDDESTKNVTNSADFSGYDMAVLGEQTVTVTYDGVTTTYGINVIEKPAGGEPVYEKVTTDPGDWSGTYLLVVENGVNKALSGISTTKTNYGLAEDVDINDNKIAANGLSAYEITISKASASGAYKISFNSSLLCWTSGNSLTTNSTESANTNWTISLNNGKLYIYNCATTTRQLIWNNSSPRFACYTDKENTSGYYYPNLYKLN